MPNRIIIMILFFFITLTGCFKRIKLNSNDFKIKVVNKGQYLSKGMSKEEIKNVLDIENIKKFPMNLKIFKEDGIALLFNIDGKLESFSVYLNHDNYIFETTKGINKDSTKEDVINKYGNIYDEWDNSILYLYDLEKNKFIYFDDIARHNKIKFASIKYFFDENNKVITISIY